MVDPTTLETSGANLSEHCISSQRRFRCLTPWKATGFGHGIFLLLPIFMLRQHWWRGDILVDCEMSDRMVPHLCVCQPTFQYICWLSECINGTYGGTSEKIIWQSWVWVSLAVVPAVSGVWLLFGRRRNFDIVLGLLSSVYLFVGLLPDTSWFIDHDILGVGHFVFAGIGLGSGFLMQFFMPSRGVLICLPLYIGFYFLISELLISDGAQRSKVYALHGLFPALILEWTGVLGAAASAVVYCTMEELRTRCRNVTPIELRDTLG